MIHYTHCDAQMGGGGGGVNGIDMFKNINLKGHNFNDFFSTIGESNEKNIRKHNGTHFQDNLTNHTDCHFAFYLINNNDTIRIIKKIKLSKSKGHDGVSIELL